MNDRKPHVVLDAESREKKAKKIEALLGAERLRGCRRLIEVGAGSGLISRYFAAALPDARVSAVDVVDSRVDLQGYDFQLVSGTRLPFPDEEFDVAITNHVVEHVGGIAEQTEHLVEIARVLKREGVIYFAVPNRWSPWEAHYRLPLLGWFPRRAADLFVRCLRKGTDYDCVPLSRRAALRLFKLSGLEYRERTLDALRMALKLERRGSLAARLADTRLLGLLYAVTRPFIPTLVFELTRSDQPARSEKDTSLRL